MGMFVGVAPDATGMGADRDLHCVPEYCVPEYGGRNVGIPPAELSPQGQDHEHDDDDNDDCPDADIHR
jgi:hypothetical protein